MFKQGPWFPSPVHFLESTHSQYIAERLLFPVGLVQSKRRQYFNAVVSFQFRLDLDEDFLCLIASFVLPIHVLSKDQNCQDTETQANDADLAACPVMRCFSSKKHLGPRDVSSAIRQEPNCADDGLLCVACDITSNNAQAQRKPCCVCCEYEDSSEFPACLMLRKISYQTPPKNRNAEEASDDYAARLAKLGCKVCCCKGEYDLAGTLGHSEEQSLQFVMS